MGREYITVKEVKDTIDRLSLQDDDRFYFDVGLNDDEEAVLTYSIRSPLPRVDVEVEESIDKYFSEKSKEKRKNVTKTIID